MKSVKYPKPAILERVGPDDHGVIEASAGTGKTYTIEHLIVELLLTAEPAVRIDDILVVTFTRRATAELVQRVRRILQGIVDRVERPPSDLEPVDEEEPHWEIDEEGFRRVKDALFDFDRAPIYTIHGFCQRVLTEYAFENRRLFDEEHVDDGRLFEQCFYEAVRSQIATDPELKTWLEAWLGFGESLESLHDEMQSTLKGGEALRPQYGAEERAEILEKAHNRDAIETKKERKRVKRATKTVAVQTFRPVIERALAERKNLEGLYSYNDMLELVWKSLDGPRGPELVEALRDRYRFALIDEFQDTDELQWQIFDRVFFQSDRANIFYLIGDPKQAIYGFRGADVDTYLRAKERVLAEDAYYERLDDNYRSTGALIGAYNRIFAQGIEEPFFSGGIKYDEPVGCGREELALVDGSGEAAAAVEVMELTGPDGEKARTGAIRRSFCESIADEIEALIDGRKTLRLEGDEESEEPRVGPGDIFVLTTTRRRGEEMGEALERRGVRHAFYRKEGLFQTPQALHIFKALRAVAEPSDRSHRFHAYTTPFFGLELDELERADELEAEESPPKLLRRWHRLADRRQFEQLFHRMMEQSGLIRRTIMLEASDRALTNYRHIFEILTHESHQSHRDLAELVVLLQSYIEGEAEPEGDDTNLQRLESDEEAVQIMTVHKSKGLEADVVFLYGGIGKSKHAGKTLKEEDEKVRFMTRSLMSTEQKSRADAYFYREAQRLMYVAITRAKGRIYLPYMPPQIGETKRSGKVKGKYRPVVERLDGLVGRIGAGLSKAQFGHHPVSYLSSPRRHGPPEGEEGLEGWSLPDFAAVEPVGDDHYAGYRRRRRIDIASYSSLKRMSGGPRERVLGTGFEGSERADERVDDADEGASWEETGELPPGRRTGLMLHELLERVDYRAAAEADGVEAWRQRPETDELLRDTMAGYGVDGEYLDRVAGLVYRGLTVELEAPGGESLGPVAGAKRHRQEVEFYYPMPEAAHPDLAGFHDPDLSIEEGYVTGEIDLLFEEEGKIYFADWKSNYLDSYAPAAITDDVRRRYRLQVEIYTLAVVRLFGMHGPEAYEQFGGWFYIYLRGREAGEPRQGLACGRPAWEDVAQMNEQLQEMR